ncbi:DUF1045 domain-containing protein [Planktotalea arctica]|uniref:DUF1045 domain-containing protein n=1 Tax=Planktotalea arctica TaxID=1481893 RepID=UPI00321B8F3F
MFERYAIYHTFEGPLATHGAAWLGWDIAVGQTVQHPEIKGIDLAKLTERPRKYGLHATFKAPFHLADGIREGDLSHAFKGLCAAHAPITLAALTLSQIGRFFALTCDGDDSALKSLAAQTVQSLDPFRAPLSDDVLQRRRSQRLSERQKANLAQWGYPHVMEDFKFHVTLTGNIKDQLHTPVKAMLHSHFAQTLPIPYTLDTLTLAGQDNDGRFREILREPLKG